MKPTPSRLALTLAATAAAFSLAACSGGGSGNDDSATSASAPDADYAASPAAEAPAGDLANGSMLDRTASADAPDALTKEPDAAAPAVISTGTVELEAKDVAQARLDVRKVVDRVRGSISEQETVTGDKGEVASARLTLRVPAARFDEVITALEDVATLTDSSTSSEDVTAKVVDVAARIRAQRKSVDRIEALLARAETIEQVVAVETQLARRQADLDALISRQKWLADQSGMSTVNVYVEQPAEKAKDEPEEAGGFLGGLHRGWDAFVEGLGALALVVGFALPWLIVLALVAGPLGWALRRRAARRPAKPTSPPAAATS